MSNKLANLKAEAVQTLLNTALDYLEKDPLTNLSRLLDLAQKIAVMPEHKRMIGQLENYLHTHPSIRTYIHRILKEVHPIYRRRFIVNLIVRAGLLGIPVHRQLSTRLGYNVPFTILIDPTEACNLRCKGCWAGKYQPHTMTPELFDRLLREAKELGIHFIVLSGGEPLLYPHLFTIARQHSDMAFMFYTNGTLITPTIIEQLLACGNLVPAISLEGWEEQTDARRGPGTFAQITTAMDMLRRAGIPFGYSVTVTRHNYREVFSDEFIDFMMEKGAFFGWSFHYIPVGRDPRPELMITPEQRAWLAERVITIRTTKPLMVFDFWNDGELTQGCIAGGRRYFHITADGDVHPCAFIHFKALENVREKSLREVLASPLFTSFQRHQPTSGNLLRPCPLIDQPHLLRQIVNEAGALPNYQDASSVLAGPLADYLEENASKWAKIADQIWQKRQKSSTHDGLKQLAG